MRTAKITRPWHHQGVWYFPDDRVVDEMADKAMKDGCALFMGPFPGLETQITGPTEFKDDAIAGGPGDDHLEGES